MKKTVIVSAFGLLSGGLLSAQGLYNIMPYDDEPDQSLPLNWTAGASIGFDSNASPQFSSLPGVDTDEVIYLSAFIQANFVNKTPQSTLDVWGRVGATYYLENIDQRGGATAATRAEEDFYPNFRGGLNFVHRVDECLRLRSRNNFSYEQEPDYSNGLTPDRRNGSYVRFSTDNSVGYRWTERLATNTGYRLSGVIFDEAAGEDFYRNLLYNQFRYRSAQTTVLTTSYRFGFQSNDLASDSTSHYFLVGAEHELSPTTVVVLRGGAQYFDPDRATSSWSPYLEGVIKTALTERASLRAFVRYGIDDRNRRVSTGVGTVSTFDTRSVFRIGSQGSYAYNDKITFYAGANVVLTNYDDVRGAGPSSFDESVFNANIGTSIEVIPDLFVTGSLNYTDSSSDSIIRDYDRFRAQLGFQTAF